MNSIFPDNIQRVLVTGGAGFIGGTLIRRLIKYTNIKVYNLDKLGYASDTIGINLELEKVKNQSNRYNLIKANLSNQDETNSAIRESDPDLVFHFAAESHVDRSIKTPVEFIKSNIEGTFNLLNSLRDHWEGLNYARRSNFRLYHVSTDEVFGSLYDDGFFSETTKYEPRSPYSASKASSDHLVKSWYHTYDLPVIISNCTNNYGPWQFPEKLIPLTIMNAINGKTIPIYGNGENIRDWLYVEDHIDAIISIVNKGSIGESYCIGSNQERTNNQVAESICSILDRLRPLNSPHSRFIKFVSDRPGHDQRYAIDSSKVRSKIGWVPKYNFSQGLANTVEWYIKNSEWAEEILGQRFN